MRKLTEISFDEQLHLIRRCGSLIAAAGTPNCFMDREGIRKAAERVIELVGHIDPANMR